MNDIDFIKKSVPFADEFRISSIVHHVCQIMIAVGGGRSILVGSNKWRAVYYPHFLTRTIEGINSKTGYTIIIWLDTITICMGWDYINPIFVAKYNYSEQGDIDTAKRSAIEYVLERL